jgi:single-strand DNA-binding protein
MATITAVTVAGNLTRDPEIRYTREGQATTSLSVAVNRRWQNQQTKQWEESVSFLDVVCWRDLAENVALSLTKGSRVLISGRLEQRSWEPTMGSAGPRSRSWPTRLQPASGSPPPTCTR